MIKHNQDGAVSGVAVSLVFAVLLLIGAIAFGVWSYGSRQDYKNNTDVKINTAVTIAKQQEGNAKDAAFAQEEKNPLKTWTGPEAYGSVVMAYPKTWSGYVAAASSSSSGGNPVDGYFYPGVVPSVTDQNSTFAVRVQVNSQPYASVIQTVNESSTSENPPKITPYALPKVPKVVGVEVTGTLPNQQSQQVTGTMIILPLRSQTLEIWTEGTQFLSDFNSDILPNLSFSP
jgi:hypothetical protein